MSASIPSTHTAGDSFAALLDGTTYPASAGWAATLVLIGPARHTLAAAASGDDHAVSVAGASTATWPPGAYAMRAMYSKAADRYSVELGSLAVAANPAAIDDIAVFKAAMDTFEAPNPYMVGDAKLKYVGSTSFGQKRQVSVPLVVNVYKDGAFETLFVAQVD